MSDYLDRLAAELVRAAAAPLDPPPSDGASGRGHHSRRTVILASVVCVAVAAPALAILRPWEPQPRQIISVRGANTSQPPPTAAVPISSDAPPDDQRRLLAVLRRSASIDDRSPAVSTALHRLFGGVTGIELGWVRVLHDKPDDPLILLIPAKRWSAPAGPDGESPLTVTDPLCVELLTASGETAGSCAPASALLSGHLAGSFGAYSYTVVPDGVAAVKMRSQQGGGVTAVVHNNVAVFHTSKAASDGHATPPGNFVWLDAAGKPVPS